MPTKQELIESLDKPSYGMKEVKHLLHSVANTRVNPPSVLKKGDVFAMGLCGKVRPLVIVKVRNELVYAIPISSTQDALNLGPATSRFFGVGYFTRSIQCQTVEKAKEHFIGVYDNPRNLNDAIEALRELLYREVL